MLDSFLDFVEGRAVDLADVEGALGAGANINVRGPSKGPYKGRTMLVSAPHRLSSSSALPSTSPLTFDSPRT